jgi:uncharacterized membrane protein YphA (DoxX/SURF4 family)
MKKNLVSKILRILLALDMLFSGLLFWFGTTLGVDDFKLIIDRLGYPEYVLGAIGIGKILIGLNLLLAKQFILRSYSYFAIYINMFLAVYSHLAVSDIVNNFIPALFTVLFSSIVFWMDWRTSGKSFNN